jgi:DNA-binding MarR family transcriptional regulator
MNEWNLFSNHGHIIILLGTSPNLTMREIALKVGITERSAQKIINDLENDGFLKVSKHGRNNSYKVIGKKRLRHDIEKCCKVENLIQMISLANQTKDSNSH